MPSSILNKLNEIKSQKDNFITPENLKPGVNVFNVVSNMNNLGDLNVQPTEHSTDMGSGYVNSIHIGAVDRNFVTNMEPNLTSNNIAFGSAMFGVQGTYVGEGGIQISDYFITDITQNNAEDNAYKFTDLMVKAPPLSTESMYNAYEMFANTGSITGVSELDTANLVNARKMFFNSVKLTNVPNFNYHNVNDASSMFENCYNLPTINVGPFSQGVVTSNMFQNCYNLKNVNVGDCDDYISAVGMFVNCYNLTDANIGNLNNGRSTNFMFYNCNNLVNVNFGVFNNIVQMPGTFAGCTNLKNVNIPNDYFVNNYTSMYSNCKSLEEIADIHIGILNSGDTSIYNKPSANVSLHYNLAYYAGEEGNWNQDVINNVDAYINNYYLGYTGYWGEYYANQLINNLFTPNDLTNALKQYANVAHVVGDMNVFNNMFDYCENLVSLPNFIEPDKIDADPVRYLNISYTVYNAYASNTAENHINHNAYFNYAGGLFNANFVMPTIRGCKKLTSIEQFNGLKFVSANYMFEDCISLEEIPDFLKLTENYNNIPYTYLPGYVGEFTNCVNLNYDNLPEYITTGVSYVTNLFRNVPITKIDTISGFVNDYMHELIVDCPNLQYINRVLPAEPSIYSMAQLTTQLNNDPNIGGNNIWYDHFDYYNTGSMDYDQTNNSFNGDTTWKRYLLRNLGDITINTLDMHFGKCHSSNFITIRYNYNGEDSSWSEPNYPLIALYNELGTNINSLSIVNWDVQSYTNASYESYGYDDPYMGGGGYGDTYYVNHINYYPGTFLNNCNVVTVDTVNLSSYGIGPSNNSYNYNFGIYIPKEVFKDMHALVSVNNIIINSYGSNRGCLGTYASHIYNNSTGVWNTMANNSWAPEFSSMYPFVDLNFTNYFKNDVNLTTIGSFEYNITEYATIQQATNTYYSSNNHWHPNWYGSPVNSQLASEMLHIDNMLYNCPNLTVDSINNVLTFFNSLASSFSGYATQFGFKQLGLSQDQYNSISSLAVVSSLISKGWNTTY